RARAVVVSPDDLVEERGATEDLVEEHLAVVHLAIVDVEVEASRRRENTVRFAQPGLEEREIVVEAVSEPFVGREPLRPIATPCEAVGVAARIAHGLEAVTSLDATGIERGIEIDEIDRRVRQRPNDLETLAVDDAALHQT